MVTVNNGFVPISESPKDFRSLKSALWIVFNSGGGARWCSTCDEVAEPLLLVIPGGNLKVLAFDALKILEYKPLYIILAVISSKRC